MPSLRVADLVRDIVLEGRPVTTRSVSRRIAACRFVCESHLKSLARDGLARKYLRSRKGKPPTTMYVLRPQCPNTPSSRGTPASSP